MSLLSNRYDNVPEGSRWVCIREPIHDENGEHLRKTKLVRKLVKECPGIRQAYLDNLKKEVERKLAERGPNEDDGDTPVNYFDWNNGWPKRSRTELEDAARERENPNTRQTVPAPWPLHCTNHWYEFSSVDQKLEGANVGQYLAELRKLSDPSCPVRLFKRMQPNDEIEITLKVSDCLTCLRLIYFSSKQWPGYDAFTRTADVAWVGTRALLFNCLVLMLDDFINEMSEVETQEEYYKVGPGGITIDRIWIVGFGQTPDKKWIPWFEVDFPKPKFALCNDATSSS
ncbi:unnamed protein product [Somion occarium]|uniref:Uncharacterized protein n=1 Tax=Somion occarium TaxID=3059160 RepID=A0ABP1D803_9APHY